MGLILECRPQRQKLGALPLDEDDTGRLHGVPAVREAQGTSLTAPEKALPQKSLTDAMSQREVQALPCPRQHHQTYLPENGSRL